MGRKEGITKEHEETLGEHRCIHYLDCGDDFMGVYKC